MKLGASQTLYKGSTQPGGTAFVVVVVKFCFVFVTGSLYVGLECAILLPPPSPTGIVGERHHDCWEKTILSLPLPLPREYLEQKAERLSQGSQRTSDQSDLHSPESLGFIAVCRVVVSPPPHR